jgi:carboxylesterase type B
VFYPGETVPENASLPVVVYIHGGGYVNHNRSENQRFIRYPVCSYIAGNSSYATIGSASVNESLGNVVGVTLQYRLGLFGMFINSTAQPNS